MRITSCFFTLLLAAAPCFAEAPFPAALERSAVNVSTLSEPIHDAMILGNGDLNALAFAEGNDLVVRITKNDVWDARLDTALDPPLPTLARLKELGAGVWPERNWILPEGAAAPEADSYHAHAAVDGETRSGTGATCGAFGAGCVARVYSGDCECCGGGATGWGHH